MHFGYLFSAEKFERIHAKLVEIQGDNQQTSRLHLEDPGKTVLKFVFHCRRHHSYFRRHCQLLQALAIIVVSAGCVRTAACLV